MSGRKTDPLKELKKIAEIKFDRERHRLVAIKNEMAALDAARREVKEQMRTINSGEGADPFSFANAAAYLDSLAAKARRLDAEQRKAHERTEAQRERIKTALASKIRVDGMGEK
ncbi:MAG: hypothetical protein R3C58_05920 [Parvularculaceae bacterium]